MPSAASRPARGEDAEKRKGGGGGARAEEERTRGGRLRARCARPRQSRSPLEAETGRCLPAGRARARPPRRVARARGCMPHASRLGPHRSPASLRFAARSRARPLRPPPRAPARHTEPCASRERLPDGGASRSRVCIWTRRVLRRFSPLWRAQIGREELTRRGGALSRARPGATAIRARAFSSGKTPRSFEDHRHAPVRPQSPLVSLRFLGSDSRWSRWGSPSS